MKKKQKKEATASLRVYVSDRRRINIKAAQQDTSAAEIVKAGKF